MDFADGRTVHTEHSPCSFACDHVIRRAQRYLGQDGYNLFSNNYEQLVSWCRTGKSCCQQIQGAKKLLIRGRSGGIQYGFEQLGGNLGLSQGESEVAGKVAGAVAHVALLGPAGLAIWGATELIGELWD